AELATCIPIGVGDTDALATFARQQPIDLTLVGPEAPLAAGLADRFRADKLPVFGPSRAAAAIESSKSFSKDLMRSAGVPTANAEICRTISQAFDAIDRFGTPVVIKASGLAAGKGVIVCQTARDAREAVTSMLERDAFGEAGKTVLVEEFMEG